MIFCWIPESGEVQKHADLVESSDVKNAEKCAYSSYQKWYSRERALSSLPAFHGQILRVPRPDVQESSNIHSFGNWKSFPHANRSRFAVDGSGGVWEAQSRIWKTRSEVTRIFRLHNAIRKFSESADLSKFRQNLLVFGCVGTDLCRWISVCQLFEIYKIMQLKLSILGNICLFVQKLQFFSRISRKLLIF